MHNSLEEANLKLQVTVASLMPLITLTPFAVTAQASFMLCRVVSLASRTPWVLMLGSKLVTPLLGPLATGKFA